MMKTVSLLRRLCCAAFPIFLAALAAPVAHAQSVYSVVATLGDPSSGLTAKPAAVAFDSLGNVYVADTANNRIQEFDANGNYIRKFGFAGSGVGQLNKPAGIALDKSNNVYVADTGNNRIEKFSSTGAYLAQFGAAGNGNGQFNTPSGVATDGVGNVYVADSGNNRVEKFNSSGVYVSQFGTAGAGSGQFKNPLGITLDKSGNIYVADTGNSRIQKFSAAFAPMLAFGTAGSASGQFNAPSGVSVDATTSGTPNIYVADTGNNRVQKFTNAGVFTFGIGAGYGGVAGSVGASGSVNGQCSAPLGIGVFSASASNPTIYIADTANSRLQKFDKTGAFSAPPAGSINPFANAQYGNGQLNNPEGVGVDNNGNVFVANYGGNTISKFNSNGLSVLGFGSSGSSNGQFNHPDGVATDSSGNIFVVDTVTYGSNNGSIEKFDNNGNFMTRFNAYPTRLTAPRGVKVDSSTPGSPAYGYVYVPNLDYNLIDFFDNSGSYRGAFGTGGTGIGQLNQPTDVAFDSKDNIFVSNTNNNNILKYDHNGTFLSQFGTGGSGPGQFNGSRSLSDNLR